MSSSEAITRRGALAAIGLALAGCGFKPLYATGGGGDLVGEVALQDASDPETYAFRERMRRRLGDGGAGATYGLSYEVTLEEQPVAINPAADVTRYRVKAQAEWRLVRLADGFVVSEGDVRTIGAYDATAGVFATRAAQREEREEVATELAELVSARILAAGPAGS